MSCDVKALSDKCLEIRRLIVKTIAELGVGHIGGSLSIVEALVLLYYKHMNIDPKNPNMEGRDRFILSKGHSGPGLYAVLADKGYFPKEKLSTLNRPDTNLPSHPDMLRTPGVDMTTGSLGQGFSASVGIAMGSKLKKDGATIYVIIGDGESQEGQIWEAAMYGAQLKLGNLIAFTDYNGMQIDGTTDEINSLEPLDKKWEAFGWDVYVVDGHDLATLDEVITKAKQTDLPSMIILKTIKGKGISFTEKAGLSNHNMVINKEQGEMAVKELRGGASV